MATLHRPQADDVIISRQSAGNVTVGVKSSVPQIVCGSFEEALQRARSVAISPRGRLWYTGSGGTCVLLGDVKLLGAIWNEYAEMPGLRLTPAQAQRLWALDTETCASALGSLVGLKVLVRGPDGKYARITQHS
jgi:hypothetical protein